MDPSRPSQPSQPSSREPNEVFSEIFPATSIPSQPYWPSLHKLYNDAWLSDDPDWPMPQPFYRLHPDIEKAAPQFLRPLGPRGFVALTLVEESDGSRTPIAALSGMPFEGDWESHRPTKSEAEQSAKESFDAPREDPGPKPPIWEFNQVATSPKYRGRGLSSKLIKMAEEEVLRRCEDGNGGRVRMFVRTIEEVSGPFWRARGYVEVPEMFAKLPEGFTHYDKEEGFPGLRREVMIWAGEKWLR
ncbi:hypothetical protein K402DRAFT_394591 [Aulographum hederae CBS 113979]|uniref:N-acetyltransferase domain-containing protein n=1 Tax=Aulographum hederae CBS 113979 TaxID=1176131 RepID=A0A6G1GXS4_9PEZI|nr:hypothetical protein K402DRAFT_394591 [Aulographum hederae CBS 113979]